MKTLEIIVRRVFFYGAFVFLLLAAIEKVANIFRASVMPPNYTPIHLLEIAAVTLLFAIVMQLHAIRLLLSQKSAAPPK